MPFTVNLYYQKLLLVNGKQQKVGYYHKAVGERSFYGCRWPYQPNQEPMDHIFAAFICSFYLISVKLPQFNTSKNKQEREIT